MIIIEWIIEVFVYEFCGWIGYITVKAVTFGKVELEYGDSSDSVITMWIGVGVLLAVAMLISLVIGRS